MATSTQVDVLAQTQHPRADLQDQLRAASHRDEPISTDVRNRLSPPAPGPNVPIAPPTLAPVVSDHTPGIVTASLPQPPSLRPPAIAVPVVSAAVPTSSIWDYSVPVPGSREHKLIYPKVPVEYPPWSREQCHARFKFVKNELQALADRHLNLYSLESRPVYTLRMVGTSPATALPSIVVTCREIDAKGLRDLFRKRAEETLLIGKGSSFSLLRTTFGRPREEESTIIPRLQLVYYRTRTATVIRRADWEPIAASIGPNDAICGGLLYYEGASATLGVSIDIDGVAATLTVDHAFSASLNFGTSVPEPAISIAHEDQMRDDDNPYSVHGPWSDDDEYDDLDVDGDDGNDMRPPPANSSHAKSIFKFPMSQEEQSDTKPVLKPWERIASSAELDLSAPYLDWALVRPASPPLGSTTISNVVFPDGPGGRSVVLNRIGQPGLGALTSVYMVSGVRGIIQGQILPELTFLPSPPGRDYCEAWSVILDTRDGLINGECGSMIIDGTTNEVYGHVVGSDPLGHAYFVPLSQVLYQVKASFQAEHVGLMPPKPVTGVDQQHSTTAMTDTITTSERAAPASQSWRRFGVESITPEELPGDVTQPFLPSDLDTRLWSLDALSQKPTKQPLTPDEMSSEEVTEPFSQSEIDTRIRGASGRDHVWEPENRTAEKAIPLRDLQIDEQLHVRGVRLLVRPLSREWSLSHRHETSRWLLLPSSLDSEIRHSQKVLAVSQTADDIKFSLRASAGRESGIPSLSCEIYYDPASHNIVLHNTSANSITITDTAPGALQSKATVTPSGTRIVSLGTWKIDMVGQEILEFRTLEKKPATLLREIQSPEEDDTGLDPGNLSGKARLRPRKKTSRVGNSGSIVDRKGSLPKSLEGSYKVDNASQVSDLQGREILPVDYHALLDIERDFRVEIPGITGLGDVKIDSYQLTKRDAISSSALSAVFTSEHSQVPDSTVVVKVLKTRHHSSQPQPSPGMEGRNTIRQAEVWLREKTTQSQLVHESIVRLFGSDARYLSLYMEYIDAADLAKAARWRDRDTQMFKGSATDGLRILRDIGSALSYLHGHQLVHNDVKPANILYTPERGAVLCDFGLSTGIVGRPTTGGTPYYIPPEFIGRKLRSQPGDIWALGITMLYVLHKTPFPDWRGRVQHPQHLYWLIAEVNRPDSARRRSAMLQPNSARPAVEQMRSWLKEVAEMRENLDTGKTIESLVGQMLDPAPGQRIEAANLIKELLSSSDMTHKDTVMDYKGEIRLKDPDQLMEDL